MRAAILSTGIIAFLTLALLVQVGGEAFAQYPGFGDPGSRQAAGGGAGGDGIVPVAPTVDGGMIPSGGTAQVVVRFRNDGSQPSETGLIRLYPSSNVTAQVSMNQCEEEPLPTGAECAIALSVKAVQQGNWRVEMLMSHSGRTRLVTATISGSVEAGGDGAESLASDIEAVPDKLDFGSLSESQTLVQSIILRNTMSETLEISDVYLDTSDQSGYSLKSDCKKLEAGAACIAVVTWAPKLKGRASGVLVVKHSGPTGLASVTLTGEYTPQDVVQAQIFPQAVPGKGLLVASQTEIDFGDDIATASTMTVSLVNAGDAAITLGSIAISGSDNGLSFKSDGCESGRVLEPIEACPLTVSWSPTRVGAIFDDVQVQHDGARGILVLPIRGTASAAVSQDQKAIVLGGGVDAFNLDVPDMGDDLDDVEAEIASVSSIPTGSNPNAALDGFKITSFSPTRAIINGPGGSRLVFDNEEVVLGGIPWLVVIQKNGIEFLHNGRRILLLFDRSLSTIGLTSSSGSAAASAQAASAEQAAAQ